VAPVTATLAIGTAAMAATVAAVCFLPRWTAVVVAAGCCAIIWLLVVAG